MDQLRRYKKCSSLHRSLALRVVLLALCKRKCMPRHCILGIAAGFSWACFPVSCERACGGSCRHPRPHACLSAYAVRQQRQLLRTCLQQAKRQKLVAARLKPDLPSDDSLWERPPVSCQRPSGGSCRHPRPLACSVLCARVCARVSASFNLFSQ